MGFGFRHTRGLQNLSAVMGGERTHDLCARNRALIEMYFVTSKGFDSGGGDGEDDLEFVYVFLIV